MKTPCHNLPGISEIRWIACTELHPFLVEKSLAGAPISVERALTNKVSLYGVSSCITEQEDDNNGRREIATLEFSTLTKVPPMGAAFLIRQASGQWYLIGSREAEPQVAISYSTGEAAGDPSVDRVTVTFTAIKALLKVAV